MLPNTTVDHFVFSLIQQGYYWTSTLGKIYCSETGERLDKPQNDGYLRVSVKINNKTYGIQAHRLLWMKWNNQVIPARMVINHINGIVNDNKRKNLELVTYGVNTSHGVKLFGRSNRWKRLQTKAKQGELNVNAKFSDLDVQILRKKALKGLTSIQQIQSQYNVSERTALHMLIGVTYSHIPNSLHKSFLGINVGRPGRKKKNPF